MSKKVNKGNKIILKIIIVAIFLISVIFILNKAKNYLRDDVIDKINLIINNSNITTSLKKDIFIENNVVYVSKQDIENFFDPYIYYDEKYNQIITGSNTKIASLPVEGNNIEINSSKKTLANGVIKKDDVYFVPFSELEDVYLLDMKYLNNTVVVDSLDRKHEIATVNKKINVKYKPTVLSRTVEKINAGDTVVIANRDEFPVPKGWTRIRLQNGTLRIY